MTCISCHLIIFLHQDFLSQRKCLFASTPPTHSLSLSLSLSLSFPLSFLSQNVTKSNQIYKNHVPTQLFIDTSYSMFARLPFLAATLTLVIIIGGTRAGTRYREAEAEAGKGKHVDIA